MERVTSFYLHRDQPSSAVNSPFCCARYRAVCDMEISSYTFGPNDDSSTVLSLKANSRLIKDITACRDATIEFTSQKSARVTVGEEEYDLTFCDVKPTVRFAL